MLVLLTGLLFHLYAKPYDRTSLARMEGFSMISQFFQLFSGLIFLADSPEARAPGEPSPLSRPLHGALEVFCVVLLLLSYVYFVLHIMLDMFPWWWGKKVRQVAVLSTQRFGHRAAKPWHKAGPP